MPSTLHELIERGAAAWPAHHAFGANDSFTVGELIRLGQGERIEAPPADPRPPARMATQESQIVLRAASQAIEKQQQLVARSQSPVMELARSSQTKKRRRRVLVTGLPSMASIYSRILSLKQTWTTQMSESDSDDDGDCGILRDSDLFALSCASDGMLEDDRALRPRKKSLYYKE